jgi:hydrogenase expression/formation protein HypD
MTHPQQSKSEEASWGSSEHWRNPDLARSLIKAIESRASQIRELQGDTDTPLQFMEVCGSHTMAIAKWGLRAVLPNNIKLISGPGCPVCVTANHDLDLALEIAKQPDVIVASFGDMMKVPGSYESLSDLKAQGHDIRIVYSPLDALALAEREVDKQVVFIGVGFETTAPLIAASIKRASAQGLKNFSVCAIHKTVPGALRALADDPEVAVTGLILPGHVSTVIGIEPYQFLAQEFGIPSVVAGFEPVDILQSILMLLEQNLEQVQAQAKGLDFNARVDLAYTRAVKTEGNPIARAAIEEVFESCDAQWRGLGLIEGTGLRLREEFSSFEAAKRFELNLPPTKEPKGCRCGDILRGIISPHECPLFGRACTPEKALGPCMVSSEGSCAAWYRYYGTAHESTSGN